jgi:hypothetical protein
MPHGAPGFQPVPSRAGTDVGKRDQGQVENSVHTGALPGKVLRRDHAGRVG